MSQEENRESPSEAEVEALVQKAIRDITLAANEAVEKSAKEAEEAARKPPKFKPLESFDVNGQRVEIQQRSLDGYLENRKLSMELEPKPRTVQAARLFQDVDDIWGGPSSSIYPPLWPVIRAVSPIGDPPEFEISITHGYVIETFFESESGADKINYAKPEGLDTWIPVEVDAYYYIVLQRDGSGRLKTTPAPAVLKSTVQLPSVSYRRKFGSTTEAEGTYRYLICRTLAPTEVGGPPVVEKFHAGNNIVFSQERAEVINLPVSRPPATGEEYRDVAKNYDESKDAQQLRSIRQLGSDKGLPIIKPIGESEDPNTLETIDFRRIAERDMGSSSGEAQIKLVPSEDGKIIHVQGNGYDAENGGTIVKDGLVVQLGPGGGCEDGGTGSIQLIEEGESVGVPIAEWIDGCVKTNGTFQIVVRELMVCEDGVPVARKFLTIEAMPTPPTP